MGYSITLFKDGDHILGLQTVVMLCVRLDGLLVFSSP
jgi:hypothetical protein